MINHHIATVGLEGVSKHGDGRAHFNVPINMGIDLICVQIGNSNLVNCYGSTICPHAHISWACEVQEIITVCSGLMDINRITSAGSLR